MTSRLIGPRGCLPVLFALWAATTASVRVTAQDVGTDAQRESGKRLYLKYCSQCHGEKGDAECAQSEESRVTKRNLPHVTVHEIVRHGPEREDDDLGR